MTLSSLASRRSRLLAAPAVLALSIGALAGCSDSTTTTETTTSASAAASGSASESASDSASETAASGETMPGNELTGRMMQALMAAGSWKMSSPVPGDPSSSSSSEVVVKDGKTSSKSTISGASAMEIITLNDAEEMYIKSSALQIPTWTKVEANSENQAISMVAGLLEAMKPMMDPANQLKVYEKVTFTSAGEEEIDGVKTTKWTGELSVADMMAAMGGSADSVPSEAAGQKAQVEIYLDDQDRPIKTISTVGGQATENTYSDFGAPITVEAPAVGS